MLVVNNVDILKSLKSKDPNILSPKEAKEHRIRPLRMGVLNIMPPSAISATEKQFSFPIHNGSKFTKVEAFFIKLDGVEYGNKQYHVDTYHTIEQAKNLGLDCLIITGANVQGDDLSKEKFYETLSDFIKWADDNVTSTLYSCLASHAYMQIIHDEKRNPVKVDGIATKIHGNYEHWVSNIEHPITKNLSKVFNLPHSRWNEISWQQFQNSDMKILSHSDKAGSFIATSPDGLKAILLQGHPEYDDVSLLKEYVRDVINNREFEIANEEFKYPPLPHNYLTEHGEKLVTGFTNKIRNGDFDDDILSGGKVKMPDGMEIQIAEHHIIGRGKSVSDHIFSNWINTVFEKTNYDPEKKFMDDIDHENPLGLVNDNSLFSEIHYYDAG